MTRLFTLVPAMTPACDDCDQPSDWWLLDPNGTVVGFYCDTCGPRQARKANGAEPTATISDGFGSEWVLCNRAGGCGLEVVRPGKVQCWCDDGSDEPPTWDEDEP